MVPQDPNQIGVVACRSIERLLERVGRDRESLAQCGYGDAAVGMATGVELVNALAREADELKKALEISRGTIDQE